MVMWFGKKASREAKFRVTELTFMGEQDGPPERDLKNALVQLLSRHQAVRRAYLARVSYGAPTGYEVALCLAAPASGQLRRAVGDVFARQFNNTQHLDILFLKDSEQEAALAHVCRPFYEVPPN